jgi:hypothetical protein
MAQPITPTCGLWGRRGPCGPCRGCRRAPPRERFAARTCGLWRRCPCGPCRGCRRVPPRERFAASEYLCQKESGRGGLSSCCGPRRTRAREAVNASSSFFTVNLLLFQFRETQFRQYQPTLTYEHEPRPLSLRASAASVREVRHTISPAWNKKLFPTSESNRNLFSTKEHNFCRAAGRYDEIRSAHTSALVIFL